MTLVPARGFVLAGFPHKETDKIAHLYTREFGRIKAVVKGVRKPKSKMAPAVELFTEASFTLQKKAGSDLYLLTQAKVLDDHHDLKRDLATISLLQLLADILLQSLPDHEPQTEVYDLLKECLATLRMDRSRGEIVLTAFCLRFLDLSGFPLEMNVCSECGASLEKRKAFLAPHRGGALCEDCLTRVPAALKVSPAGLAVLRKLKSLPMDRIGVLKLDPSFARELFLTILDYQERTIEKKLKALGFYLQLVQVNA